METNMSVASSDARCSSNIPVTQREKRFHCHVHPDEVRIVGAGLLIIGGAVLLVSVLGCIGAHREKPLLLMMVSTIRSPAR